MTFKKLATTVLKASQNSSLRGFKKRNDFLKFLSDLLKSHPSEILKANQKDVSKLSLKDPMRDRLMLNAERIENMRESLIEIKGMTDPLDRVLEERTVSHGLHLKKITVPLGVIGVIYESRPNVTVDLAGLAIKSGNALILRGGSDAYATNQALLKVIHEALGKAGLPEGSIQLLSPAKSLMEDMLKAVGIIDVLIPRGGKGLIDKVRREAKVPVIETGAGVVHMMVDSKVDLKKAVEVIVNAKVSRPSVCNSLDTLLVHEKIYAQLMVLLLPELKKHGVKIMKTGFGEEFLSLTLAIKKVASLEEALEHIQKYSSKHSESILTSNKKNADRFLKEVDAAAVYVNTSTRFTDGGMFGMGAEVGISTQKLHARGPMGLNELTSYKWIGESDFAIRL